MREEKLTGGQRADIILHNIQWGLDEWQSFCKSLNAGLIIEDGEIKGYVTEPTEYRI